ncbi:hypothetical protein U0070_026420, partial [Myodes glareolus]
IPSRDAHPPQPVPDIMSGKPFGDSDAQTFPKDVPLTLGNVADYKVHETISDKNSGFPQTWSNAEHDRWMTAQRAAVSPAAASPAVVSPAAVSLAAASPAVVSPAAVPPAAASPAAVPPAAANPAAVSPAAVNQPLALLLSVLHLAASPHAASHPAVCLSAASLSAASPAPACPCSAALCADLLLCAQLLLLCLLLPAQLLQALLQHVPALPPCLFQPGLLWPLLWPEVQLLLTCLSHTSESPTCISAILRDESPVVLLPTRVPSHHVISFQTAIHHGMTHLVGDHDTELGPSGPSGGQAFKHESMDAVLIHPPHLLDLFRLLNEERALQSIMVDKAQVVLTAAGGHAAQAPQASSPRRPELRNKAESV